MLCDRRGATDMIPSDGIKSITLHGNVVRIQCVALGAEGKEEHVGTPAHSRQRGRSGHAEPGQRRARDAEADARARCRPGRPCRKEGKEGEVSRHSRLVNPMRVLRLPPITSSMR